MKRKAAIVGRTPEFVRWSIRYECVFRRDSDVESPEQTERLLRNLREVGMAIDEGRIHDGLALKCFSDATEREWCGVFIDEVFAPFGGHSFVNSTCANCPASVQQRIAGCTGMLLATDFNPPEQNEWYRMWARHTTGEPASLADTLIQLRSWFHQQESERSLVDLETACALANEHGLSLDVCLFPGGFSDGLHWTVDAHCPNCKAVQSEQHKECRVCGRVGAATRARKRRVLGRRPFLSLQQLLGKISAQQVANWCREKFVDEE